MHEAGLLQEGWIKKKSVLSTCVIKHHSPLGQIICTLGIQYTFNADDSPIYVTFNTGEAASTVTKIEEAITIVKKWKIVYV